MKRSKKKLSTVTRRQFMGCMGTSAGALGLLSGDPFRFLAQMMAEGLIQKAHAQGSNPRKVALIHIDGGAVGWRFFVPLDPYGGRYSPHAGVNTRFSPTEGASAGAPQYASVPLNLNGVTLRLPHVWSLNVPSGAGGTRPLSELASHALFIRGIRLPTDGHEINRARQIQPISTAPSINGMVADASQLPFPAVGLTSTFMPNYRSQRGTGLSVADYTNSVPSLLAPFNRTTDTKINTLHTRKAAMSSLIDEAMLSLGNFSRSQHPAAGRLFDIRHQASKMLATGLGEASVVYPEMLAKYREIIRRVFDWKNEPLVGLTDKPISTDTNWIGPLETRVTDKGFAVNEDLRTSFNDNTQARVMAEVFAAIEYLFKNNLSSSIVAPMSNISNLNYLVSTFTDMANPRGTVTGTASATMGYTIDEHTAGESVSILTLGLYFAAFGACLTELMVSLKGAGMWEDTVVGITTDFSRIPNPQGSGTSHGPNGQGALILTGALKQPMVLGNIQDDKTYSVAQVPTGWGYSGTISIDGAVKPGLMQIHYANTVCAIAGVQPIAKNFSSLVTVNNSSGNAISPIIDVGKNL